MQEPAEHLPVFLTAEQAAILMGISERTFHSLREKPWMPRPVVLGPRIVRWVKTELIAAAINMPRQGPAPGQPPHLTRGRIEKQKRQRQAE